MGANDREKALREVEGLKVLQYGNEHTIFALAQSMGAGTEEKHEPFSMSSKLEYVMNLCNFAAASRGVTLQYTTEACFPGEVTGSGRRLELLVASILRHLISCSRDSEVRLTTKLVTAREGGFLLCFDFAFKEGEELESKRMRRVVKAPAGEVLDWWKDDMYQLRQCDKIAAAMGGTLDFPESEPGLIRLELPFAAKDAGKESNTDANIAIYQCERLGQFSTKWTPTLLASPSSSRRSSRPKFLPRSVTAEAPTVEEEAAKGKIRAALDKLQSRRSGRVEVVSVEEEKRKIKERLLHPAPKEDETNKDSGDRSAKSGKLVLDFVAPVDKVTASVIVECKVQPFSFENTPANASSIKADGNNKRKISSSSDLEYIFLLSHLV